MSRDRNDIHFVLMADKRLRSGGVKTKNRHQAILDRSQSPKTGVGMFGGLLRPVYSFILGFQLARGGGVRMAILVVPLNAGLPLVDNFRAIVVNYIWKHFFQTTQPIQQTLEPSKFIFNKLSPVKGALLSVFLPRNRFCRKLELW